ncbi:carboxymuconolactone decarboxylase family protein [Neobacillus niacini]|uniref:carboxymuconolactone decarboxylase family protein n=1 Tax=Neobacillus niacini TaxID=86668 RepID=UPI0030038CCF
MNNLTERQKEMKEKFIQARGYWAEHWNDLLTLDEEFFGAFLNLSAVPWKKGSLDPKVKEFIYIAINASTTHLYEPGIQAHMQNAIKYGATPEEIMEVLELTSALGIHTCASGIPILMDELKNAGVELNLELTPKQKQLKEQFKKERGYWSELNEFLLVDDGFFEAYLAFSALPWKKGVLEPKIKEFIYIAIDVATTHLYEPGARMHIKNALKYGADKEELMEVLQLVSVLGIHTCTVGVPILKEVMKSNIIES